MLHIEKIKELSGHLAAIFALAETDKPHLISGGADRHIIRWNYEDESKSAIIAKTLLSAYSILEHAQLQLLFIGTASGEIHVIDSSLKEEIKILKNHHGKVFDLKIHQEKLYSFGEDGNITITDTLSLQTEHVINISSQKIRSADFNNNKLALACGDGYIRVLDVINHKFISETPAHEKACNVVKFHPELPLLISGGWDAHLKIWDNNLQLQKSIPAHNYAIYSIEFSPNHTLMATGSRDKTIKIWNALNPEHPKTIDAEKLNGHKFSVNKILWDKKSGMLFSTGDDKKIMIWKIHEV